jgi:outer membrane protein OmpA-like peptidoglycan-associated protein/ABC-type nitrate/sulfonate/bicarbonate transport system substrate-binding protein
MGSGSRGLVVGILLLIVVGIGAFAYKYFSKPSGPPLEGEVEMPFIFWGGDVATFHANGGLETTADSFYGKKGLKIKLTPGDDFDAQLKNYKDGKSYFLRGTLSMLGQASKELTADTDKTPVVFMQLTWSAGDHLVGRKEFENLDTLKGKKIALQKGGPHVGMLADILRTTKLGWRDIKVVWTDDVSGDKGPAAAFRKDGSIDACFAISPEMFALTSAPSTGGIDSIGDGTKESVKGAHVVVSTQHMARSIADVYACRGDVYRSNKDWIEKFVAGYLKSSEDLTDMKTKAGKDKAAEAAYHKVLELAQSIWSKDKAFKDSVAKLDDVDGLVSDAVFVGLPGNESFFKNTGNLSGFKFKQEQACKLPDDPSIKPENTGAKLFTAPDLSYDNIRKLGELRGKPPTRPRIASGAEIKIEPDTKIYTFRISFKPDESEFNEASYGNDFQRALEVASLFGNTVVAIRGHADPNLMVQRFLQAATSRGIIRQDGARYIVVDGGKEINLQTDTKKVLDIIAKEPADNLKYADMGGSGTLRQAVATLQDLSVKRANRVQKAITDYATNHKLVLDSSQIRTQGVGVSEPEVGYARTEEEAAKNRRVEFIIIKVPADKLNADEFDL